MSHYRGRFAPSPTGLLHRGSLVAALASYLDAKAHHGAWLLRIRDIDPLRRQEHATRSILATLHILGMQPDERPIFQSNRYDRYQRIFDLWLHEKRIYPCGCSRKDVAEAAHAIGLQGNVYPGTCREGLHGKPARAYRYRVPNRVIHFIDRWQGPFSQNLRLEVGDFVVRRADGLWAYQLAATVDDIDSRITHIVRGADLLDNTPRQIYLWENAGKTPPQYLHVPLVCNAVGTKLSKQQGATPLQPEKLQEELDFAWTHLGFSPFAYDSFEAFYREATRQWKRRWGLRIA